MKHLLTILILLPLFIAAQNISIPSFQLRETDMDARVNSPKTDQNGEKCAIIKVVTTEQGFVWEGDALGIVDAPYKTGEYWLYVPHGAKRLTVKHSQLGILRDYLYPLPIKEATVYEMKLESKPDGGSVEIALQWVIISSEPSGADVYFNDEFKGTTPFQQEMLAGAYTYRIEYPLYGNEAGRFDLTVADGKKIMDFKLKKNYGSIQLASVPESGAKVFIDGIKTNKTTPCKIEQIKSGDHTITLQKELYKPTVTKVLVENEKIIEVIVDLIPNYSTVKVNTSKDAEIFIDEELRGIGFWEGNLMAGFHSFEARKDVYKSHRTKIEVIAGQAKTINLQPQPKYGKLKIISNPFNAQIKLRDSVYGTTPMTIDSLFIGEYDVEISKMGYKMVKQTIEIETDETTEITTELHSGIPVTFNSSPQGAKVFVNGAEMGVSPCELALDIESYKVKFQKKNFNDLEVNVSVSEDVKKNIFSVNLIGKLVNVNFNSEPKGAKVFINDLQPGKTNLDYQLNAGEYLLEINKNGYLPIEQKIELSQNQTLNFALEINGNRTKGKAVILSTIWPGAGQNYLNRGGVAWLTGFATYGLLYSSVIQNNEAVDAYNAYKASDDAVERSSYKTEADDKYKKSQTYLYAAIGTWAANMLWVALIPPDSERLKNVKPNMGYNAQTGSMQYGLTMNLNK